MQSSTTRDFAVGLFVLIGVFALAYLSIQVGGLSYQGEGGLALYATFDDVGGLTERSVVAIGGVRVGRVTGISLDDDLRARVSLDLDRDLELPVDSSAAVRTAGLLGDQFVAIEPGAEEEILRAGEFLAFTESATNLDKLIGTLVHDSGLGDSE